ncbi:MAG: hypothetical protein GY861_19835 [bacterium]|nr:hypothetical protein [bacterium]
MDEVFKRPTTPKVKEASLTITTTPETRVVQVQQKEDPYKDFVEIEAPAHMFILENQYYAQNTIMGQYTVLNRKTPGSLTTKSTSTVAAATVTESAKTSSQTYKPFGSLTKDQWEPEPTLLEKLEHERQNILYHEGTGSSRYKRKVQELKRAQNSERIHQAHLKAAAEARAAKEARDQATARTKEQDTGQVKEQDDKQAEDPDNTQMQDEDE